LVIASTTKVANLNVDQLDGADWAAPPAIGSGTPAAGSFTTLSATGNVTLGDAAADTVTVNGTTNFVVAPTVGGVGQNGFKNRLINSAMVIDQRNAGASVTPVDGQYTVDRWQAGLSQASKFSVQQSSTSTNGFTNSLLATSLAATSMGAGDIFAVTQKIEGLNFSDMAWGTASAQAVTLSFWVRSSLTGTFGGSFTNSANNRSYPFTFTISSANTFEYKTVTVAGDTSGTWLTTNGVGVRLWFGLGMGSTYSGTAGAWAGAAYFSATGATNVLGTNGATFYITGVQLEKGSTATSFDYRPYGTELALCQRYCFKMSPTSVYGPYGMGHGVNTTTFRAIIKTAQTMRAQPSVSFTTASGFLWSFGNVLSAITAEEYGTDAFSVGCTSTGLAANGGYLLTSNNNTTSSITATAEL
jgi:hypothetical protein